MEEVDQSITYRFWVWQQTLCAVLTLLSSLVEHTLRTDEFDQITYGLLGTNDEEGRWFEYVLGNADKLSLTLAVDDADSDIIHLSIRAHPKYYDRIKRIDSIQHTLDL